MVKVATYSQNTVRQLYDTLSAKQRNGASFQYEIQLDGEAILPRTDNLEGFYSHVSFITEFTCSVEILVYLGKSKRYHKYVFNIEGRKPNETDIEKLIQDGIARGLKEMETEQELKRLHKKVKDLKELLAEYRHRVQVLESSGSGLQGLVDMLQSSGLIEKFIAKKMETPLSGADTTAPGISNEDIMSILNELRSKLGESVFQQLLGTAFKLADHPDIIPAVRNFIEQTINNKKP